MSKKEKVSHDELMEQILVKDEDKPYEVPSNWIWTRFGNVIHFSKDKFNPIVSKLELKYVGLEHLGKNRGIIDVGSSSEINSTKSVFRTDDIIYGRLRPYLNKHAIVKFDGICSTDILVFRCIKTVCKNTFINYYLDSDFVIQYAIANSKGINLPRVSEKELSLMQFPLPPLPEQERIVNIIEPLFEKLDRAKELVQNVCDSYEHRQSAILHKAFKGELSANWRGENSNIASYEIIKEQRLKISEAKHRNQIDDMFNSFDVNEHRLPNDWIKLKAMMVCDIITCGNTPSDKINAVGDIPFLKVYNIVNNKIDFNYRPQFIDVETHRGKLKSSKLFPNDIVMNIVGPPLRKIAIIPNDYPEWNMNQAIVRFRTIEYVDYKFFYYCLLNDETLDEVIRETKGVVGQANISITQSRNLLIPIPSLEEQKEIVRILDNLFENEQRAKELYDVIENIDLMKKSILARAFRGELSTNNPDEESALELLKEVLRKRVAG